MAGSISSAPAVAVQPGLEDVRLHFEGESVLCRLFEVLPRVSLCRAHASVGAFPRVCGGSPPQPCRAAAVPPAPLLSPAAGDTLVPLSSSEQKCAVDYYLGRSSPRGLPGASLRGGWPIPPQPSLTRLPVPTRDPALLEPSRQRKPISSSGSEPWCCSAVH